MFYECFRDNLRTFKGCFKSTFVTFKNIPQTVLALWGSGVFKAGDCDPGFPASRTFSDTQIVTPQLALS